MKKFWLSLVVVLISSISASFTFAGYSSTQIPGTSYSMKAAASLSPLLPTNIVIINFSPYYIYAAIPGTPVYQGISSGGTGLLTHDSYAGNTTVAFYDQYNRPLFDRAFSLCRYAIATINQGPSVYRLNVNNEYCYLP